MYSHFEKYMMLQMLADKEKKLALEEIHEEVNKQMKEYEEKVKQNNKNKESD